MQAGYFAVIVRAAHCVRGGYYASRPVCKPAIVQGFGEMPIVYEPSTMQAGHCAVIV